MEVESFRVPLDHPQLQYPTRGHGFQRGLRRERNSITDVHVKSPSSNSQPITQRKMDHNHHSGMDHGGMNHGGGMGDMEPLCSMNVSLVKSYVLHD